MNGYVRSLFVLVTVCGLCNATPPFQQITKKLETLYPPGYSDRHKLREFETQLLTVAEQFVASNVAGLGNIFCREVDIDWMEAWNITMELSRKIDMEEETLCGLISNHIEAVLDPFTSRLDQCGNAHRSGPLGRSIVLAFKALAEHICSITGEQILEMFNTCAFEGRFTASQCKDFKNKIETLRPGQTTDLFTTELCHVLPLGQQCLMDTIGQNCHLDYTKKAWEELFTAILTPCSRTQ